MENQIIQFIKKISSHFTKEVFPSYLVTSDLIQLDLIAENEWNEVELRALKFICKSETEKFTDVLVSANFDKDFLISSIPLQKKIRIKWFKNEQ